VLHLDCEQRHYPNSIFNVVTTCYNSHNQGGASQSRASEGQVSPHKTRSKRPRLSIITSRPRNKILLKGSTYPPARRHQSHPNELWVRLALMKPPSLPPCFPEGLHKRVQCSNRVQETYENKVPEWTSYHVLVARGQRCEHKDLHVVFA
jgi:hypothetical protein